MTWFYPIGGSTIDTVLVKSDLFGNRSWLSEAEKFSMQIMLQWFLGIIHKFTFW